MSVSTANAADELGRAYLIGSFGTEFNWSEGENSGVSITSVDGDAQYQCTWDVSEATSTGSSWFLTVVIVPADSVDNFASATFPDLSATIDGIWIDGEEITGYDASSAVNTNYFEDSVGVTKLYLRDDWAGTSTRLVDDCDIESSIKVVFTVSGTGATGTSNVTTDNTDSDSDSDSTTTSSDDSDSDSDTESTTVASDDDDTSSTTTDADSDSDSDLDSSSTTTKSDSSSSSNSSSSSSKSSSSSTTTETSADTSNAGVGFAVVALAIVGTAAVAARKRK